MTAMQTTPLTPEQKKAWTTTRSALMWGCPAFTSILFNMMNPTGGELAALFTEEIPIAATDGSNLILNPKTYFAMPLQERVFVAAHEIMHCILNHCSISQPFTKSGKVKYADGTQLKYDPMLMNVAMDFVINDILVESRVGTMPQGGCWDRNIATSQDSFMDAYKKVYKQNPPQKSFDVLLAPGAGQGKDPGKATQDRSQTEWDTAVAAAIASAKAQGKLPAGLQRLFKEILEPEVSWQDHIKSFFARRVGGGSFDWRKPDRRFIIRDIFVPTPSGDGCGDVVVAIDTSGSIGQRELDRFFGEMRGILDDVQPQRLFVVWCDAKVHHVDELDSSSDLQGLKPHGGGGTDFRPVFDWIHNEGLEPDALVYLTDGMGSFPDRAPTYPVLWGNIWPNAKYPFGDVVEVKVKQ